MGGLGVTPPYDARLALLALVCFLAGFICGGAGMMFIVGM